MVKIYELPKGRKQWKINYPVDLADDLLARGVKRVEWKRDGEIVTIRPVEDGENV
jgi:hypothetical protein